MPPRVPALSLRQRAFDWALERAAPEQVAQYVASGSFTAARVIDRAVGVFSPDRAVQRAKSRQTLARYEGAQPSRHRRTIRNSSSGDMEVQRDARVLREIARDFDRNLDLARGVLSILVRNIVGPTGIGIEPMPRRFDGTIHHEFADALLQLHTDWKRRPEVTQSRQWASCERLACRSWLRDGEMFAQLLVGRIPTLDHGTRVPFSLELLEADLCPLEFNDASRNIRQGVEHNTWGRKLAYHVYKGHPGDAFALVNTLWPELKRVDAQRILHPIMSDRISQMRGVSIFASVLNRLHDVKDYEDSERVAAKVAASMAAVIVKGGPEAYGEVGDLPDDKRYMKFAPGTIFDDLAPGERVEPIDTKRPNTNLPDYRKGQLQAASRGTEAGYSSMSGDYDGSYSSQRQELVEQDASYGVLADEFIGAFSQPAYNTFVRAAIASGQVRVPDDVDPLRVDEAEYHRPPMPWIDHDKEMKGIERALANNLTSEAEEMRKRGRNYRDVLRQKADFRNYATDLGVPLLEHNTQAAGAPAANDSAEEENDDAEANR